MHQEVEAILSRMSLDPDANVSDLSAGMKRRVLLARALVRSPDILLLDEPTNHLDMDAIRWLEEFLLRYGGTILFVTHDRALLRKAGHPHHRTRPRPADKLVVRLRDLFAA